MRRHQKYADFIEGINLEGKSFRPKYQGWDGTDSNENDSQFVNNKSELECELFLRFEFNKEWIHSTIISFN